MYPTLYHLIQDLFGIEFCLAKIVQSFGFFVAMAFLAAAYSFSSELKRKEKIGLLFSRKIIIKTNEKPTLTQNLITLLIGFLIGFKFTDLLFNSCELAENIREYLFSMDGNLIGGLAGAGISSFSIYYDNKKLKSSETSNKEGLLHPYQLVSNMTMIAAIFGISGAKLFHLLENPDEFSTMFDSINSFFSGLTIYGGLIIGGGAVLYYAHKNGLKIIHVFDACAPALLLSYGIGRIGCQISGDGDWGIDNLAPKPDWMSFLPDWVWAYNYPHNVISAGKPIPDCIGNYCYELANPVWPTPFYESTMAILLFVGLWSFRHRIITPGLMTSLYLIVNGIERFFIEKIRINEVFLINDMLITQAEIIAVLFVIAGSVGIWYFKKVGKSVS